MRSLGEKLPADLVVDRYMRGFCWRYNRRQLQESIFDLALTSILLIHELQRKLHLARSL